MNRERFQSMSGKGKGRILSFFVLVFIQVQLIITLLISGCSKQEVAKKDDFSTGLANRDPRVLEGINYIQEGNFNKAINFFRKFTEENPNHCGYLIGYPLAQVQRYLSKLSAIINFVVGAYGGGGQSQSSSPFLLLGSSERVNDSTPLTKKSFTIQRNYEKQIELCDESTDKLVRDFVSDLYRETKEGLYLFEKAINQGCEIDIEYPLSLSVGPNFSINITLYGRMGDTELKFLNYFGYSILILSGLILSHDFSTNLVDILSNISKLDLSNITGVLRTLAVLVAGCSRTFSFHSDYQSYITEIPNFLVKSLNYSVDFLESLEKRNGKEGYAITFSDGSGEGKLGYDIETVSLSTTPDMITLQVKGSATIGDVKGSLKSIKIKVPYLISFKFVESAKSLIEKIKDIAENKKKGCPENCISIADINFALEALDVEKFDDFARIDLMHYFENPKPLRELLPYWFKNPSFQRWEFMIEAEVPQTRQDLKYYLYNYDAPHFTYPPVITFYGRVIDNFSIPKDCISAEDLPFDWILIPYIMFQDPTLAGMLYMRLKNTFIIRCGNIDVEYDTDEWKPANLYMINKLIAVITRKTGSIINPLTKIILESVEIEQ